MTTDTTAYQLHKTTAAALPAQWAWQVGGARLGGVGVDWDTGHVNFNLRERGEREKWLVYIYTLILMLLHIILLPLSLSLSLSLSHMLLSIANLQASVAAPQECQKACLSAAYPSPGRRRTVLI